MPSFIIGDKLIQALYDAGLLEDYTSVARVVIDIRVGEVAKMYVEKYTDTSFAKIVTDGGVEIVETAAEAGPSGYGAPRPL